MATIQQLGQAPLGARSRINAPRPGKVRCGACVDAPKVHVMLVGSCSVDTNSVANRQTENLPLSNSGHISAIYHPDTTLRFPYDLEIF